MLNKPAHDLKTGDVIHPQDGVALWYTVKHILPYGAWLDMVLTLEDDPNQEMVVGMFWDDAVEVRESSQAENA